MHTYNDLVAQRVAQDAAAYVKTNRQLAEDFLTATQGDPRAAVGIAKHYVKALHPGFIPRRNIGSPAERVYSNLQAAVARCAKTWTPVV
ncbi:hypothetical protein L4X63_16935 [Geomonas sp. Red32]|uniref:hypothetical protein n=1 Tax=Geomonas sp. Red32 TaxID=2912856 RepID=UPI00202CC51A|nr:hypothetical protein [Geomonas sp. Red32]MCM0083273.1 hypothetical protein [Geomonas sp. Red32]